MTKRNGLSIKVDYLSIVFDTLTVEEVIAGILRLPIEFFVKHDGRVKFKKYTVCYQFGSIRVYTGIPSEENNPNGLGCYLVMSGRGCSDLEECMRYEYENVFKNFFHTCEIRVRGGTYHLTRIDIAIDDKNEVPYFTVEQIQKKCLKEEFVSKSKKYRFVESSFDNGSTAKTAYIGDGKSNISYRFYDKDKEVSGKRQIPIEEIGSWKRTEIQLRDETAHEFSQLMRNSSKNLGELTFGFLSENLRFVTDDKTQSNKSRRNTSRFWKRFIGAVQPLELQIDKEKSGLKDTANWLREGGALSAVKAFNFLEKHNALNGLESVEMMLLGSRYSKELGIKVINHLHKAKREELIPVVREKLKF